MVSSWNRRYFQVFHVDVCCSPWSWRETSKPLSSIGIGKFRRLFTVDQIFTNLILPRTKWDSADSWQDREQFPYVGKFAPSDFPKILSQLSSPSSCSPVFHSPKLKECQRKIQISRCCSYPNIVSRYSTIIISIVNFRIFYIDNWSLKNIPNIFNHNENFSVSSY